MAVAFGWLVSMVYKPAFGTGVVIGYWITNVVGLLLLHKGAERMIKDQTSNVLPGRALLKSVLISLLYTLLILMLVKLHVLQPIVNYLPTGP